MLETPHVVVGAAIAAKLGSPYLSLPLAFASHFILDKVPHWNPHLITELRKNKKVKGATTLFIAFDSLCALILGSFIAFRFLPDTKHAFIIILACLLSILPDLIEAPYFFLNLKGKTINRWVMFQKSIQENTSPLPGLITQAITIAAALWWIYK